MSGTRGTIQAKGEDLYLGKILFQSRVARPQIVYSPYNYLWPDRSFLLKRSGYARLGPRINGDSTVYTSGVCTWVFLCTINT